MRNEKISFVHISDLHFDAVSVNNHFSWISGYAGHDFLLVRGFQVAIDEVRVQLELSDEDPLHVIVSGDLTRTGHRKEFAVAHSFLRSLWILRRIPPERFVGLATLKGELAAVPGNHDHWRGRRMPPPAYDPLLFEGHFRRTPWKKPWTSRGGRLELEIYGLDSNAGLIGKRTNFRAKGRLGDGEIKNLGKMLQASISKKLPSGVHRVRALLLHHSTTYSGGLLNARPLEPKSLVDILDLAKKYDIAAVLTGHTHNFDFRPMNIPMIGGNMNLWELRSATTLQGPQKPHGQGFWAHQISLEDDYPVWRGWRYAWNGNEFVHLKRETADSCVEFPAPDHRSAIP